MPDPKRHAHRTRYVLCDVQRRSGCARAKWCAHMSVQVDVWSDGAMGGWPGNAHAGGGAAGSRHLASARGAAAGACALVQAFTISEVPAVITFRREFTSAITVGKPLENGWSKIRQSADHAVLQARYTQYKQGLASNPWALATSRQSAHVGQGREAGKPHPAPLSLGRP